MLANAQESSPCKQSHPTAAQSSELGAFNFTSPASLQSRNQSRLDQFPTLTSQGGVLCSLEEEERLFSAVLFSGSLKAVTMLGGKKEVDVSDTNSLEIDELANFAVSEHNNRQNSLEKMNFSKVVSCHKQVVSGLMYHMVIEVEEGSKPKQYEAKVWVKPGGASKKLEEFKPKDGGLTSADMGVKSTGLPLTKVNRHSHGPPTGKQTVPSDDPVVQEAAEHAVRMLQQGSNSLATYKLSEIVSAEAELKDEAATFDLLLKTKRGTKEEVFKSEVHRTGDGQWSVKHATLQ